MDLATILLLLETPPPKGGYHNFLIEHLTSGASGPTASSPGGGSPAHKRLSPTPSPSALVSSARSTPIAGRKLGHHQHLLVKSKNYYCSNPMLNNSTNLYCNLDMESLEEMLKKLSSGLEPNWAAFLSGLTRISGHGARHSEGNKSLDDQSTIKHHLNLPGSSRAGERNLLSPEAGFCNRSLSLRPGRTELERGLSELEQRVIEAEERADEAEDKSSTELECAK
uniref:Uncharacterized protein n=1 Tax=Anopheles atroparvus TaxID=41427 RepID=A0A182ILE6_ANOAO